MTKHLRRRILGLTLLTCSCGDKADPGIVETPTDTTTGGTTAAEGTTGTYTTGGSTTGGSTTAGNTGSTTTGGTTAGSTTGATATGLCGTSATTIGYAAHAKAVFTANCTSCHGPGGSQNSAAPVDTYANAKKTFQSTNAQDRVDSGNMPLTGKMASDKICIVDAWVAGGYQP